MAHWIEPHDCKPPTHHKGWAWSCIICDIEAMRVRCLMGPGLENSSIILGDDWVMIVPPRPFGVGFLDELDEEGYEEGYPIALQLSDLALQLSDLED